MEVTEKKNFAHFARLMDWVSTKVRRTADSDQDNIIYIWIKCFGLVKALISYVNKIEPEDVIYFLSWHIFDK